MFYCVVFFNLVEQSVNSVHACMFYSHNKLCFIFKKLTKMCSSLRYLFLLKIILFEIQEKVIIATAVVVVHKKSPKIFQTRELC